MELNTLGAMVVGGVAAGIGSLITRWQRERKGGGGSAGPPEEDTIVTFGRRTPAKGLKDVRRQLDR